MDLHTDYQQLRCYNAVNCLSFFSTNDKFNWKKVSASRSSGENSTTLEMSNAVKYTSSSIQCLHYKLHKYDKFIEMTGKSRNIQLKVLIYSWHTGLAYLVCNSAVAVIVGENAER